MKFILLINIQSRTYGNIFTHLRDQIYLTDEYLMPIYVGVPLFIYSAAHEVYPAELSTEKLYNLRAGCHDHFAPTTRFLHTRDKALKI